MKPTARPALCWGLAAALSGGVAGGAEPCPWRDAANPELSAACARWDLMALRVETAERRAASAEQALAAMQAVLDSMQRSLQMLSGAGAGGAADASDAAAAADAPERAAALVEQILARLIPGWTPDYQLRPRAGGFSAVFEPNIPLAGERRLEFGRLELQFLQQDQDPDHSRVRLDFGERLRLYDDAETLLSARLQRSDISGLWSTRDENFSELRLDLDGLLLRASDSDGQALGVEWKALVLNHQLRLSDDDVWRQRLTGDLRGLRLYSPAGELTISGLSGESRIGGERYRQHWLREPVAGASRDAAQADTRAATPIRALFGDTAPALTGLYASTRELQLSLRSQEGRLAGGVIDAGLGELTLDYAYSADPLIRMSFALELDGLDTPLPISEPLRPRRARLELVAGGLPPGLLEALSTGERDPAAIRQALDDVLRSTAEVSIENSYLIAPEAAFRVDAQITADARSPLGASGELNLEFEALQQLIEASGADRQTALASTLAMVNAFSARSERDGVSVDTFALRFTADGKILLNDKDITALLRPGA